MNFKKIGTLLALALVISVGSIQYNDYSEKMAIQNDIRESFHSLKTEKYVASVNRLIEHSISANKFLQENEVDWSNYQNEIIEKIKTNSLSEDDLFSFRKMAKDSYEITTDDVLSYIKLLGEQPIIEQIHHNLITEELLSAAILSDIQRFSSENTPYLSEYYSVLYEKLNSTIQEATYPKVRGTIIGRLSIEGSNDGNRAAIVDSMMNGRIAILYWEINRRTALQAAASSEDTYEEKKAAQEKVDRALNLSPQFNSYVLLNVAPISSSSVISTKKNEYKAYKYCLPEDKESCKQFCNDKGECGAFESYDSHMARKKREELSSIFNQFHIPSQISKS